jgi:hypothetical protein
LLAALKQDAAGMTTKRAAHAAPNAARFSAPEIAGPDWAAGAQPAGFAILVTILGKASELRL